MHEGLLIRPAAFAVATMICCAVAAEKLRPAATELAGTTQLEVSQAFTGANSRLQATQRAHITDQATWLRVWRSHLGVLDDSADESIPSVDFSKSVVVAVVEEPDSKRSGIRVAKTFTDDEHVWIDYEQFRRSDLNKPRGSENVYGFFVIPRNQYDIVLRRRSNPQEGAGPHDGFQRVARFPASHPSRKAETIPSPNTVARRMLNIGFAHDPGAGKHDGVVGSPNDLWNLVSMGTTAKDFMRYSDASASTARMRISRHDGAWGIEGQHGIFRGYIYDNSRSVDLEATVLDLPAGRYRAYVYAHGDAPNQNARIELEVGEVSLGKKATANDGTWRFRSSPFIEGIHYVRFDFEVAAGDAVKFISHRDGSDLSMFNAIQLVPMEYAIPRESPGRVQHEPVEQGVR